MKRCGFRVVLIGIEIARGQVQIARGIVLLHGLQMRFTLARANCDKGKLVS